MSGRPWSPRPGLAGRLLLALVLVVTAGGLTAWIVAAAIGPAIFHQHMVAAGVGANEAAIMHAEEAFRSASGLALGLALGTSVLASLVVSLFLTQRIAASLSTLSSAASRVAGGTLDARVEPPGLGQEFDGLAEAFNDMAAQLQDSEALRRRLLADVAHEVRTPVAILTAYLEGLEDGVASLTPQTLTVLRAQGSRLTRLADDLAAVTRAEGGDLPLHLEETDPAAVVDAAVGAAAGRFGAAGIDLQARTEPSLPTVLVDRERMGQVLGNLLDNALRHTPSGGQVLVGASADPGGAVRFTVEDDGQGIDPTHLPHLFERFYRADTARDRGHGGSGIGLAIVRALVHRQGGTVSADSEGPGSGATFEVRLPPSGAPRLS